MSTTTNSVSLFISLSALSCEINKSSYSFDCTILSYNPSTAKVGPFKIICAFLPIRVAALYTPNAAPKESISIFLCPITYTLSDSPISSLNAYAFSLTFTLALFSTSLVFPP